MSVWDKQIGGQHYQKFKIQPSKFVVENELLYPEGCAIKYIIRHRMKGKRQDLEKAIHFIEMIIERDYPEKKDFLEEIDSFGVYVKIKNSLEPYLFVISLRYLRSGSPSINKVSEEASSLKSFE